jgi:catalase
VGGTAALASAGLADDSTGVVSGDAAAVAAGLVTLLGSHRVWERFTPVA